MLSLLKNRRKLSQALSQVEGLSEKKRKQLWEDFLQRSQRPYFIGVLGTPGSGKSTFLNNLLKYRQEYHPEVKLGLLLVDPSHPYSGGALLGDRVRMSEFYLDQQVFMRSLSNKGEDHGLTPFLADYLMTFCQYDFDLILVESVGGGQAATSLQDFVDETLLIFDPSSGDGIQHLKNGVLDVIEHLILSKADKYEVGPIQQSLQDWTHEKLRVWPANLQLKESLHVFFEQILFSKKKIYSSKFKEGLAFFELKRNIERKLKKFKKNYSFKNFYSAYEDFVKYLND